VSYRSVSRASPLRAATRAYAFDFQTIAIAILIILAAALAGITIAVWFR
jgi:hypothetical protein